MDHADIQLLGNKQSDILYNPSSVLECFRREHVTVSDLCQVFLLLSSSWPAAVVFLEKTYPLDFETCLT